MKLPPICWGRQENSAKSYKYVIPREKSCLFLENRFIPTSYSHLRITLQIGFLDNQCRNFVTKNLATLNQLNLKQSCNFAKDFVKSAKQVDQFVCKSHG